MTFKEPNMAIRRKDVTNQRDLQILPSDARASMLANAGIKYPAGKVCAEGDAILVQALCDRYFDQCKSDSVNPTVTGLLLALGIYWDAWGELRKVNYPYAVILKKAHLRIAQAYESKLLGNTSPVGAIYWLKNNTPWKDQDTSQSNLSVAITLKRPDDLPPIEPTTIRTTASMVDD